MDANQIRQVRRFNRLITQRAGALDDSYLRRGRPLGEARIIHEVATGGADMRDLRIRLGLDSGYFSRLLRSLEGQGLINVSPRPDDARRRQIGLTRKGLAEYRAYSHLSDQLAASILAPLDPDRRDRLINAMREIERLIRAPAISLRVEPPGGAEARRCLAAYFQELAERFDTGFDPGNSNSASDLEMTPPNGWFVVARLDGEAAGCGALKRGKGKIGEIKRMWTAPAARGMGIAQMVLRALEDIARDAGITTLRLETNRALTEAQALYRRHGYREVARFNNERYAHHWFEKRLKAAIT